MKLPTWLLPLLLRFLSLTGLTSGVKTDSAPSLLIGLALSPTSQPHQPVLSLDLDFVVQLNNDNMPLHLLGKKSWNVYNADNIAKVKRDEAAAKAKEEAEEECMQEEDAERRMKLLRGEVVEPLAIEDKPGDEDASERRLHGPGRERKKRKRYGENDTDFELRIASEQVQSSHGDKQVVLRRSIDAPLVDDAGHIDLFPQEIKKIGTEKNAEAEAEAAKKKKEYEDQYTMRFANAAGFKQGLDDPWYSRSGKEVQAIHHDSPGKDVWGNEDPRKREREAQRVVSSDPLAMMKQGAAKVRQVEKDRKRWRDEKAKELKELESEERRNKRKRRYEDEEDDLEGFCLDRSESSKRPRGRDHDRERSHHHEHGESRHRSRRENGIDEHRHKHRHRHRHRD